MTVETKPSNVNDSNQEAEPDQLLDDEGNKNPPVKKTSSCTGLKVQCLSNTTMNYHCSLLRNVVQGVTCQIPSLLFPLSFVELDTYQRHRGQSNLIFFLKKVKIHDLPYLLTSYLWVDPLLGHQREAATSSGRLEPASIRCLQCTCLEVAVTTFLVGSK